MRTILLFLLFVGKVQAEFHLTDEFYVTQHWLSWTTSFDIETDERKLGSVHRRFFSWTTQYDFYNINGDLEATAKSRFWSLGASFDVSDVNNHIIGHVDQKLLTFFPTYQILSNTGEVLGKAKMNLWGTTYYITDPVTSLEIAQIYRSFFRLKDNWTVKIVNRDLFEAKGIDPRLFVTLAIFQSDVDTQKRYRRWRQQQEQLQQDNNRRELEGFAEALEEG